MTELNPNHPVTMSLSENWHKIVALLVLQQGGRVTIKLSEVTAVADGPEMAIAVKYTEEGIELFTMTAKEGERLAAQEGGLPS